MTHNRKGKCEDENCKLVHPADVINRLSQAGEPWLDLVRESLKFEEEAVGLWLQEVDFIAAIADMGAIGAMPALSADHLVAIISLFLATCDRIEKRTVTPLPIPEPQCTCPNGEHNDPPGPIQGPERQAVPDLFIDALSDLNVEGI